MPASSRRIGPGLGYRPLIDRAAFTTPPTSALTSAWAETPSRSSWSITAISPGATRWTNRLVLGSTRARPPCGFGRRSGRRSRLLGFVPNGEASLGLRPLRLDVGRRAFRPVGAGDQGRLLVRERVAESPGAAPGDGTRALRGRPGRAAGLGQQLLGVSGGGVAPGQSREHPRELVDPLGVVQKLDRRRPAGP